MQLTKTDWVILALALLLRVWGLDGKPPHFDEGINGWFVDQMKRLGFYEYDPHHYHGPLHFYVLFVSDALFGRNVWALRLPVVIVSFFSVVWMLKYRDFLGRRAAQVAAVAMAVSPAFVFYGRYSIHEAWQVFFNLILVWGALGLWLRGEKRHLYALVAGLTGLILTKETYVIHAGSVLLAFGALKVWEMIVRSEPAQPWAAPQWTPADLLRSSAIGLGVIVFFYSGTFLNLPGVAGLGETFSQWFTQTVAEPKHEKSWAYWLELMARYEWPALAGLACGVRYLPPSRAPARLLAILGAGVLAAYTLIPYKTPWCLMSILWPFYFVLGAALGEVPPRWRKAAGLAAAALILYSAFLSIRLNFFRCTDSREPYVYVQTSPEITTLTGPLFEWAKQNPAYYEATGAILLESYYPLPWILGDFSRIGYYGAHETDPQKPDNWPAILDQDFIVIEKAKLDEALPRFRGDYLEREFELRDGMGACAAFFRRDKFPGLESIKKAEAP
ncbi:MAG TPA: flippase activity-associated protein Agl23 [Chthoniobacterales bacterium]